MFVLLFLKQAYVVDTQNKTLNETLLGVSSPMLLFSVPHPLDHKELSTCQTYQKGQAPGPSVERF